MIPCAEYEHVVFMCLLTCRNETEREVLSSLVSLEQEEVILLVPHVLSVLRMICAFGRKTIVLQKRNVNFYDIYCTFPLLKDL